MPVTMHSIRSMLVASALVLGAGAIAEAQTPARPQAPEALRLRQRIEDRFARRVQEDLGLDDQQAGRLKATASRWASKRRELEVQERELRTRLAQELRPGVAADQDDVGKLTDRLIDLKIDYVETYREEMRELERFLTPVQRAQYYRIRENLLQRVQEIREQRFGERGAAAPRARPAPR